jgi:uncharacterized membrane protein
VSGGEEMILALFIVAILVGAITGWAFAKDELFPVMLAIIGLIALLIFLCNQPGLIP